MMSIYYSFGDDNHLLTDDEIEQKRLQELAELGEMGRGVWSPWECPTFKAFKATKCYDLHYPKTGMTCYTHQHVLSHLCLYPNKTEDIWPTATLFTKYYPKTPMKLRVFDDLTSFEMIKKRSKVAIITHGFGESIDVTIQNEYNHIKDKLLMTTDYDAVIIVDATSALDRVIVDIVKTYHQAMANTLIIGEIIGNMIIELALSRKIDPATNIHLIGFSLGCQSAKWAGKKVTKHIGKKVARITALDPAAPMTQDYPGTQVEKGDAHFIDVIHTTAGFQYGYSFGTLYMRLGRSDAIGDVDFFPNGGWKHPDHPCPEFLACLHNRAKWFYIASFFDCSYQSVSCESVNVDDANGCIDPGKRDPSQMGFHSIKHSGRGFQYLKTTATHNEGFKRWC